jgi:hypothetical protein
LWPFEHFSSRARSERQMADFREVIEDCDLHDLGFSGVPGHTTIGRLETEMSMSGLTEGLLPHAGLSSFQGI